MAFLDYEGLSRFKSNLDTVLADKADLDSAGKVPASQLPSYVDDVLEYASMANFPATGESGKIYIALDTNKTYRWGGSTYVEISNPDIMTGATANANGTAGLVPAPLAGEQDKLLVGNGTWQYVSAASKTYVLDTVTNTSGSYTHNTSLSDVTSDMKAISLELSNPEVFLDKINVYCHDGYITLSCNSVAGTSSVSVTVLKQARGQDVEITTAEFDVIAARVGLENAGEDVSLTIASSSWSNTSPYTYTWESSKVTTQCRIMVDFDDDSANVNVPYITYEKVEGGVEFTAPVKPTQAVKVVIHIIQDYATRVLDIDDETVSSNTIAGASNVKQALTVLNNNIVRITPTNTGTTGQILRKNSSGGCEWDNAATQQEIGTAVTNWLDANVPTGTTVVVDKTLTVANAAAEAKATGDKITHLESALNANQDTDNAGAFTYNSFCQGQRLQNNPTSIQAVDDRCTTESLLRLHKGDEITITAITSGQSVYVYSRTTTSGWKTGTLYYCVPADGEYWVNIKNGDDNISPSDISYGLNIYVNTVANGAKREADSLSERMKAVDGKYYLDPKNFDIGNIQISGSGWNYPDNNTTRVRTKEGITYRLNVGDIISLSDYTNAQFYFGWLNTSDVYKTAGSWKTSDYAVTETGDYVILIANTTEATQTSIDALFNLLSIKQSGYELKRINTEFDDVKQEFVGMLYGTSFMPTFTNQMYNVNLRKFFSNDNRVSFDKPYPVQNGWKINIDVATGEQYYMLYMNKVADTGVLDDDYEYVSGSATGWKTEDKEYTVEGDTYVFIMVAKTTDNTPINKDTVQTKITFTRNYETGDADLPVYWDSYMQGKVEDINEAMDDIGGNGDAFIFITDIHWGNKNQKHSPDIIKYLLKNTSLTSVYCGGDVIDASSEGFDAFCKAFKDITMFTCRGNHDQNPNAADASDIIPDSTYYNRILKPIEYLVNTSGKLYYYRDNVSEKIRYIFMDSGSNRLDTLDTTQLTWMKNALTSLDSTWSAVVIQHIIFNGEEKTVATLNFAGQGNKTIAAINEVYSQLQCKFIGVISGHVHRDYYTTDATYGYPIIATSCDLGSTGRTDYDPDNPATPGTTDEQIMDVFLIDKENETISVIRIGAGQNRGPYSYGL